MLCSTFCVLVPSGLVFSAHFCSVRCFLFSFFKVAQYSFQHYIWMGRYNHSLSLDATIMVSKKLPNHW